MFGKCQNNAGKIKSSLWKNEVTSPEKSKETDDLKITKKRITILKRFGLFDFCLKVSFNWWFWGDQFKSAFKIYRVCKYICIYLFIFSIFNSIPTFVEGGGHSAARL